MRLFAAGCLTPPGDDVDLDDPNFWSKAVPEQFQGERRAVAAMPAVRPRSNVERFAPSAPPPGDASSSDLDDNAKKRETFGGASRFASS